MVNQPRYHSQDNEALEAYKKGLFITDAMTLHIGEIAQTVAPGAHAVVLMDQAGRHMTEALITTWDISVVPLPHEPSGRAFKGCANRVIPTALACYSLSPTRTHF